MRTDEPIISGCIFSIMVAGVASFIGNRAPGVSRVLNIVAAVFASLCALMLLLHGPRLLMEWWKERRGRR